MLHRLLAAVMVALSPLAAAAAQQSSPTLQEYSIDVGHSIIEFSIPFAFSRVKGRFTDWRGVMLYDRANPANSSVSVVIEAKSIDTGWPHRDEHLRTSDFFDVEQFPRIVFQSERVRTTSAGLVVDGKLTMHGVTKELSLPIQLAPGTPQRGPESGHLILDANSTARLAPKDFGILGGAKYNSWFTAARAATMGDSVTIALEVEGWLPDAASQRPAPVEAYVARITSGGVRAQIDRLQVLRDSAQHGRTPAGTPGPPFSAYYNGQDLTVRALVADGRTADAVALAEAMTSLFGNFSSFVLHGYALAAAGKDRDAAAAFARAKTAHKPPQDDDQWWQLNDLALTAIERGQRRPAVEVARLLSEAYPTNPRAFVTVGRALAANGDTRGATDAFATALRLDPYEPRALEWSRRIR